MSSSPSKFADLQARVFSAVLMALLGGVALWMGGAMFTILAVFLIGFMGWELHKMLEPDASLGRAEAIGVVCAIVFMVFVWKLTGWFAIGAFGVAAALIAWRMPKGRWIFAGYIALIFIALHGLLVLRAVFGFEFVLWLVLVVIASDVAGYFAGRLIGGPKFWPKVSPKKTWSGTVAGWVLAGLVGAFFAARFGLGSELIAISALLAFAGQMGDILQSAIKRHAGVKDSSNLIPGHGGLLDRFDAMIAVGALAYILSLAGLFSAMVS